MTNGEMTNDKGDEEQPVARMLTHAEFCFVIRHSSFVRMLKPRGSAAERSFDPRQSDPRTTPLG
jgi:hypothetical protein